MLRTFTSALLIGASIFMPMPTMAKDIVDASAGQFFIARTWFQFENDVKKEMYRAYSTYVVNGSIIDLPNTFMMSCAADLPYMTVHFPSDYRFKGFGPTDWLPETKVHVRADAGTFSFAAELNKNEFYIDLTDDDFDNVQDIWATEKHIDFRLGPALSEAAFHFSPIDDSMADMLEKRGKKIVGRYSFLEMRTRCHAASHAARQREDWKVFGSISCLDCALTDGKAYTFVAISTNEKNESFKSPEACDRARNELTVNISLQQVKGKNLVTDLLCIGPRTWH